MKTENLYDIFLEYKEISTDSRKCKKNALFFALKGESFDGNKYAESALENGCSYAIVDDKSVIRGENYILVDDVLETLQKIANYHRKQLDIPIIGITGSNGKTTTKELITTVLRKKYKVVNTIGNLNNHIGVPLTLLSIEKSDEIAVVEMGANHVGEIGFLCNIAEPDYGIITNIGIAHLEGFGSFENIILTKTELYNFVAKNKGTIFYNSNNKILIDKLENLDVNKVSYGKDKIKAENINSDKFLSFDLTVNEKKRLVNTQLVGAYNAENVSAAACIGNYFKVNMDDIIAAIEEYAPKNNRSQFLQTKYNNLFLDAYNANPTSLTASLNNFNDQKIESKCVILGDMLELGAESEREHQKIIELISGMNFSTKIVVGDIFCSLNIDQEIKQFKNVEILIDWLKQNSIVDSNILIKGSRGIKLERVTEYL